MVGKINCICSLEEINEFHSIWEFERFQKYIEELVKGGDLIEVPVQKQYAGFPEQWYGCKVCPQIWRLVHPDFPFKGIWEKVK
jgi:hypothetical protein